MSKKKSLAAGGWVVIIPLTAGIAAYLWFVFFPGMKEMRELRADIGTKQSFLAGAPARAVRMKAAQEEEKKTADYVRRWRGSSAKAGDVAKVLGRLSETMKTSGVVTTAFRPEPKQSLAVLDRVSLSVGCVGTFAQVQTLLATLEGLPERIWIEEARFECDGKDREKMRCELKPAIFVDNFEISD